MRVRRLALVPALALALFGLSPAAVAGPQACEDRVNNTVNKLLECVTVDGVREHQAAFQEIADENGGTRASGTPGYDASVDYVVERMEAAGYDVTVDPFEFPFFQETATPEFERISPNPTTFVEGVDFLSMTFSGSGDVTGTIEPVDLSLGDPAASTSGCEAADYAGFTPGNVALVQRGTCTFALKASNAETAGAVGVIVFNQGTPGRTDLFGGTLGGPGINVPVISVSFALGQELITDPATVVRIFVEAISENRMTANVLAETPGGKADNVVMAGGHLDSVPEGPGIQDNGSGSAALLEIAEQMAKVKPRNKLRFAWWGAEEFGLLGSIDWVLDADAAGELEDVALYLNFDMIGSPNFVRFIYNAVGQPPGSEVIQALWQDYFAGRGLETELVDIGSRSDHFGFAAFGIPIGGLFTGAEVHKTPEQVAIYGGTAGIAYDPCYHQACDTFDNISLEALGQMSDAAAFAILTYSMNTESVNGVPGKGNFKPQNQLNPVGLLEPAA